MLVPLRNTEFCYYLTNPLQKELASQQKGDFINPIEISMRQMSVQLLLTTAR